MKKTLKRVLVTMLIFIVGLNINCSVLAADKMSNSVATCQGVISSEGTVEETEIVDADIAATIAMLFVIANMEKTAWGEVTNISNIVPLYNNDDKINAYCVNLETNGKSTGYIVISTDLNMPLIQEYSDTEIAFVDTTEENGEYPRTYYYGPMKYSLSKEDIEFTSLASDTNDTDSYNYEKTENFIKMLRSTGVLSISANTRSTMISDPITYLRGKYPNSQFTLDDSASIGSNSIYGYVIAEWNACTVYATAAIVHYYCYWYSYQEVVSDCLRIARERGYASYDEDQGEWNYYIQLGDTEDFVQECLNYYEYYATANSSLLTENVARNEINNGRPVLLNIAISEQYSDHTVTAFAWEDYLVSHYDLLITFFGVKDGYTAGTRYVCWSVGEVSFATKVS